jgi:hypothetical protein
LAAPPLDPEAAAEYRWRVGVRFDPHATFPPDFRQRVCRELAAALRPLAGDVGRVEVHDLRALSEGDRTPVERLFLGARPWDAFAADEARTLTGVKQHLVRVAAGRDGYRVEARQLDGTTGLASPAVRTRTTRDPQEVAREAGLLVGREFGAVGTVERDPADPELATVRFKGGALPGFGRLAKAGDVFAVGVIRERARPVERDKRGRPLPVKSTGPVTLECQPRSYELLRLEADPQNGVARARALTRYKEPLLVPRGALGIRCLKLATADGPVAVRVVGDDGKPPAAGSLLQVRATDATFAAAADPRDGLELRNGVYRSARPLKGVACVTVGLAGRPFERFPVALTDDAPVTLRFTVDPQEAARAAFGRECEDFRGRVAEAAVAADQLAAGLADLIVKGQNPQALVRANQGLTAQEAEDKLLAADLGRLRADPLAADPQAADLLASAERQLDRLRADRQQVRAKADELKEQADKMQDPVAIERQFRAKELADRIKKLVDAGEVPEALDLYDQLIEVTNGDEQRKQKAKLAADWEPKDAAHRRAREYVADVWRKLPADLDQTADAADKLPGVVAALTAKEDRLGLRQLLAGFEPVYVKLKGVADKLDPAAEADKAKLDRLKGLAADLRKQDEVVRAAIKTVEGTK